MTKKTNYNDIDRRQANPLILEKLDRINSNVNDIKVISEDNRRTLRGYNTVPGIVAGVNANADAIKKLEGKSNRNDIIVGIGTVVGSIVGFFFGDK